MTLRCTTHDHLHLLFRPASHPFKRRAGILLPAGQALPAAVIEENPLWEAGGAMAILSFPTYRGSNRNQVFAQPAPDCLNGSEYLEADREGVCKRCGKHWIGAFLRGAGFGHSPLVSTRDYAAGGVAVSGIPGESSERGLVDE